MSGAAFHRGHTERGLNKGGLGARQVVTPPAFVPKHSILSSDDHEPFLALLNWIFEPHIHGFSAMTSDQRIQWMPASNAAHLRILSRRPTLARAERVMTGTIIIAGAWCIVEDRQIVRAVKASRDHRSMVWAAGVGRVDRADADRPLVRLYPVKYA